MTDTTLHQRCSRFRCYRVAVPGDSTDDPMCGPHQAGARRAAANAQQRQERAAAIHAQEVRRIRQERYVQAWREQHADRAYTRSWRCPLCGRDVQSTLAAVGGGDKYTGVSRAAIEAHQATHAEAWAEYQAMGREDAAE